MLRSGKSGKITRIGITLTFCLIGLFGLACSGGSTTPTTTTKTAPSTKPPIELASSDEPSPESIIPPTPTRPPTPKPTPIRYPGRSEEDRSYLLKQESTMYGFASFVTDELYFMNNAYTISMDELDTIVIQNPNTEKSLRLEMKKVFAERWTKSVEQVADEIYSQMLDKLGEPPEKDPNASSLPPSMFAGREAIRRRYPDLWKQDAESRFAELAPMASKRTPEGYDAKGSCREIVYEYVSAFGAEDPMASALVAKYREITGDVVFVEPDSTESRVTILSPLEANQTASSYMSEASKMWKQQLYLKAIEFAEKARIIRVIQYGPDHPEVAKIDKMIESARTQAAGGGQP